VTRLGSAMSSADLATVIIACPTCGTRYQVPYGALGAAGRDVQCAQCGNSWRAKAEPPQAPMAAPVSSPVAPAAPESDRLFSAAEERALDAAFEDEAEKVAPPKPAAPPAAATADADYERTLAEIRAAIAPKPAAGAVNAIDPAQLKKTEKAFAQRQKGLTQRLPIARLRRSARLAALVALFAVVVLGLAMRNAVVTWFPQLAGLYAAIGLPVNVVGLEFEGAKTLTSLRDGKTVMQVSARIRSVANHTVDVPPVLVSLLDASGTSVYAWTVAPQTRSMDPGDLIDFVTDVTAPPDTAMTVQLSFTNPGGGFAAPLPSKDP